MSRTKRNDYLTGKKVNDGKMIPTTPSEINADGGVYKKNHRDMDFGGADKNYNKRLQKKVARRAIRLDGKNIVRKEMEE